jgi:AAA family ATP:ADP antiporter
VGITLAINNALNIRPEERTKILLLLIQSAAFGVFISYYYSYINALFLQKFTLEYLPKAYLVSGIIGYLTSLLYSFLSKRMAYSKLLVFTLSSISVFMVALILGFALNANESHLAFVGFVCFAPISGLGALCFWGMALKLFDLREGKRLFSVIAIGEVLAGVFGFLTFGLLFKTFGSSSNILFVGLAGAFLASIFQVIILRKYSDLIDTKVEKAQAGKVKKSKSLKEIFSNKYFKSIFFLSIFSMIGVVLVDYSFLAETKSNFSTTEQLGKFFGFFFALQKVIEFLSKAFFAKWYLEKFGVGFGLAILPLILSFFTLFAFIIIFLSGHQTGEKNTFVFISLAFNMFFLIAAKKSLEDPSFKTLFQPIDISEKISIQTLTEGKARQLGALFIGLVLIIINWAFDFSITTVGVVLLLINLCFWLFSIKKVSEQYKFFVADRLNQNANKMQLRSSENSALERLNFLMNLNDENVSKSKRWFLNNILPGIEVVFGNQMVTKKSFESLEYFDHIEELAQSWNENSFKEALIFLEILDKENVEYLIFRLSDKFKSDEFKRYVDNIENLELSRRLFTLLLFVEYRGEFILRLYNRFILGSQRRDILQVEFIRLIQLMGNKQDGLYDEQLFEIVRTKNIELQIFALLELHRSDYQVNEHSYLLVKGLLFDEVEYYTWLLASISDLKFKNDYEEIRELLVKELSLVRNMVLVILAILYEKKEVDKIRYALDENKPDQLVIALELFDLLVDEEFKSVVLPVLDDTSLSEKLAKLSEFYPQRRMGEMDRLKHILNFQYNKVNDWIRIKCMYVLSKKGIVYNEVISFVFGTAYALKETAYLCLASNNNSGFEKYINLEKDLEAKQKITKVLLNSENFTSQNEIVSVLKKSDYFKTLSEGKILRMINYCKMEIISNHQIDLKLSGDCIYVVQKGTLILKDGQFKREYLVGNVIGLEDNYLLKDLAIQSNDYFKLIKIQSELFWDLVNVYPDYIIQMIREVD